MSISNYIVCSTQRSGSTMFCKALESLTKFGRPTEKLLFLERSLDKLSGRDLELKKMDALSSIREAVSDVSSTNGVFGIKIMASTARKLPVTLKVKDGLKYEDEYVKHIFWRRKDKVAQAVSHFYLRNSGAAHAYTEEDLDLIRKKRAELTVRPEDVEKELRKIYLDEAFWKKYFILNRIDPLVIFYEDFIDKKSNKIDKAVNYLGGDVHDEYMKNIKLDSRTKRISDEKSSQAVEIARKDMRGCYHNSFEQIFF